MPPTPPTKHCKQSFTTFGISGSNKYTKSTLHLFSTRQNPSKQILVCRKSLPVNYDKYIRNSTKFGKNKRKKEKLNLLTISIKTQYKEPLVITFGGLCRQGLQKNHVRNLLQTN